MARGRGRGKGAAVAGRRGGGRARGRGRGRGKGGQSVGQFLAPRTGRQAGATANAQASAEYNPEIRNLRQEAKGSRKRQRDLGQWYAQLAADYGQAQSAGSAALQSIQDTTSAQLAEAAGRSSADLAKLSAEDEAFAQLVGGPKDTEGLAKIAQAGAAAQRSRVSLNAPVAQEQANFVGRLGSDKTAARMQGIESRQAEARRRSKIRSELTGVRKEKGAARVGKKEEIRQADRGYVMDRKQLKLSQREAKAAEQQAAADAALARIESARQAQQDAIGNRMEGERIGISAKNARTSARSQRATARNNRADNRRQSAEAKAERGKTARGAATAAKALYAQVMPRNAAEWGEFQGILEEKEGIGPLEAKKAADRLRKKGKRRSRNRRGYNQRKNKIIIPGSQITK